MLILSIWKEMYDGYFLFLLSIFYTNKLLELDILWEKMINKFYYDQDSVVFDRFSDRFFSESKPISFLADCNFNFSLFLQCWQN